MHWVILEHLSPGGPRVVPGLALHVEEPWLVVGDVADGALFVESEQV